jgi:AcrR family transcriptional regulator
MTKDVLSTKEIIMDTAISLFNTKGYDGTSVRDISNKARVNPANISYYFQNKQGLLEAGLVHFFEHYLSFLEEEVERLAFGKPSECLKRAIYKILAYQSKNHFLTRFVWREISIDSQVVREIISSYLMKERFLFKRLLEEGMGEQFNTTSTIHLIIIQLKSMLTMPFLNSQYLREVLNVFPQERYFIEKYYQVLEEWVDKIILDRDTIVKKSFQKPAPC